MSRLDLIAILDECVSRLRRGDTPESCLVDYPAYAAELAPDLALTADLLQLSPLEPSPDSVSQGYEKMMAALDGQEAWSPLAALPIFAKRLFSPLRRQQQGLALSLLRTVTIVVVLLAVAGSFVVTAAADSLPGDMLYPVKRSWENTRLVLTVDESSRQKLQREFDRRRRSEVEAVIDLRKPVIVEFKGTVESSSEALWLVDGLALVITAGTKIEEPIVLGQKVAVRAQAREDGSLDALKIVGYEIEPRPTAVPTRVPPATETAQPTRRAATPTPMPSVDEPRAEPTATVKPTEAATRPASIAPPADEPTPTHQPTERPTHEPTSTHAPSLDRKATETPTREPHPTETPVNDSLATSVPPATSTPVLRDPTPTHRPSDQLRPSPTATSKPNREPTPTHEPAHTREPTGTRPTDGGDQNIHPP
jgi:hypothetical protein